MAYYWVKSDILFICKQICMKTIMIDDETYKKLKNMKGEKSFSKFLSTLAENAKYGSKKKLGDTNMLNYSSELWKLFEKSGSRSET